MMLRFVSVDYRFHAGDQLWNAKFRGMQLRFFGISLVEPFACPVFIKLELHLLRFYRAVEENKIFYQWNAVDGYTILTLTENNMRIR